MRGNKHRHSGQEPLWLPVLMARDGETYEGVSQVKGSEIMMKFMGREEHASMSGPLSSHPFSPGRAGWEVSGAPTMKVMRNLLLVTCLGGLLSGCGPGYNGPVMCGGPDGPSYQCGTLPYGGEH
jgi:hypothetical protein